MRNIRTKTAEVAAAMALLNFLAAGASAQIYEAPQYPQYTQYPDAMPPVVPAVPAPAMLFSADQLDSLLAPVAPYPDPLLAELLPASTFPQDVVDAEQWLQATANPTEQAIQGQPWDPSVQALVHYPTVLQYMAENMDWTQALGAAFLNQPNDVMDSVQRLRAMAQADQSLQSTAQQQVVMDDDAIRIEPVNPDLIYVPAYDPDLVYRERYPIGFGIGLPIGLWFDNDFDWHRHGVVEGGGWYGGWRHPPDWDAHPPAWAQHRRPETPRPWIRPPEKPAPRVTRTVVTHLGLDHPKSVGSPRPNVPGRAGPETHQPNLPVGPKPPEAPRNAFDPGQSRAEVTQEKARARAARTPRAAAHPAPTPHVNTPTPHVETPAPRVSTPAPRVVTPAPRVVTPAPAPAPRVVTPRPAPVTPAHVAPAPPPRPATPGPAFPSGGNAQETRQQSQRGNSSLHK